MVLDLVLIGLAITLDPLPVTAFVLVLSARGGIWKGLSFVLAWLAGFVAAAKLAIGVGLVWYADHARRRRGKRQKSPGPMSRLDRISPWTAAGLALLLQQWGMVAAGAATVVEADLSHAAGYAALMGYCLPATSSLLAGDLRDLRPRVGPGAAREAAYVAGGPSGPGDRESVTAAGAVPGRQEHLPADRLSRGTPDDHSSAISRHRIARGLTGEPVAAGSRRGAITQRNDQRASCTQMGARSSNRR